MTDQRCGTVAGYMRHRRRSEPACRPCLDAKNAYSSVRDVDTRRAYQRARGRALQRLATQYAEEYRELFAEERRKELIRQARKEEV